METDGEREWINTWTKHIFTTKPICVFMFYTHHHFLNLEFLPDWLELFKVLSNRNLSHDQTWARSKLYLVWSGFNGVSFYCWMFRFFLHLIPKKIHADSLSALIICVHTITAREKCVLWCEMESVKCNVQLKLHVLLLFMTFYGCTLIRRASCHCSDGVLSLQTLALCAFETDWIAIWSLI